MRPLDLLSAAVPRTPGQMRSTLDRRQQLPNGASCAVIAVAVRRIATRLALRGWLSVCLANVLLVTPVSAPCEKVSLLS